MDLFDSYDSAVAWCYNVVELVADVCAIRVTEEIYDDDCVDYFWQQKQCNYPKRQLEQKEYYGQKSEHRQHCYYG